MIKWEKVRWGNIWNARVGRGSFRFYLRVEMNDHIPSRPYRWMIYTGSFGDIHVEGRSTNLNKAKSKAVDAMPKAISLMRIKAEKILTVATESWREAVGAVMAG